MTDNELLLALSDMLDNKLEVNQQAIVYRLERMEKRIKRIEDTMTLFMFHNENEIVPRLQNIESCYTSAY